jgi:transcription termination/antitermination protein NusA
MKNEFMLAFNEVLEEKGLPKDTILQALSAAMVSAYRKSVNASTAQEIEALLNMENGDITILAQKEVVESVENPLTEATLEYAREFDSEAQLGDLVMVDSTPEDFGRVAAQTARQAIQTRIRMAENSAQYALYEKQIGEIVSGIVQAANPRGLTIGLELKAEGSMPRKEMIPHEHFRIHDRVRALVAEVKETGHGPQIILSRTHRDFLRRLLENEVPEIFHGVVEIRSIAREPGFRAKVAVSAAQKGIDPVGACVGMRGVRIQGIVRELHGEKIDVIEWNPSPTEFIAKAISPARVVGVYLHESVQGAKNALVVVPEDQLSLAIGKDGQNARLAAKLTGWRIDIKSLTETVSDWLFALKNEADLKTLAEQEDEAALRVEEIMGRKAEGRILSNEENDFMAAFVDRLEKFTGDKRASKRAAYQDKKKEVLDTIPQGAFDMDLSQMELSESLIEAIQEAGITTAGNLVLTAQMDPDKILEIQGIGPKTLEKIEEFGERLPELVPEEPEPEPEPEPEAIEEPALEAVEDGEAEEALAPEASETEVAAAEAEIEAAEEEVIEAASEEEPKKKKVESVKSFEELFKLDLEEVEPEPEEFDEDKSKSKGKKSKKSRRIEFDEDLGMTVAKKKHKRGDDDWSEWVDI